MKGEVVEINDTGSIYEDFAARVMPEKPNLPLKEMLRVKIIEVLTAGSEKKRARRFCKE